MSKREPWQRPIPFEALQRMISALESEEPLPERTRKEIIDALDCLFIMLLIEEKQHTPGRRRSMVMDSAAHMVHLLVTHYKATVKSACCVVMPRGDSKSVAALERHYQKMKKSDLGFREFIGDWRVGAYGDRIKALAASLSSPAKDRNK